MSAEKYHIYATIMHVMQLCSPASMRKKKMKQNRKEMPANKIKTIQVNTNKYATMNWQMFALIMISGQ